MIILALGSNLSSKYGDRFTNLNLAISYLELYGIKVIKRSSFFETPSYPNKKDPKFINIVAQVSSTLPPEDLASVTIFVETKLGRTRNKKNEPRTCDIDIIDFNSQVMNFKYQNFNFTVPHVNLDKRNFVLFPLKEIFPEWIHPKSNENINSLIDKLSEEDRKSIYKVKNN